MRCHDPGQEDREPNRIYLKLAAQMGDVSWNLDPRVQRRHRSDGAEGEFGKGLADFVDGFVVDFPWIPEKIREEMG